jgi:hypothetical protein
MLLRATSPSYHFIGIDNTAYFQKHIQLSGSEARHKKLLDVVSMARLAPKLGGWTLQNYSILLHAKTGGKKKFLHRKPRCLDP